MDYRALLLLAAATLCGCDPKSGGLFSSEDTSGDDYSYLQDPCEVVGKSQVSRSELDELGFDIEDALRIIVSLEDVDPSWTTPLTWDSGETVELSYNTRYIEGSAILVERDNVPIQTLRVDTYEPCLSSATFDVEITFTTEEGRLNERWISTFELEEHRSFNSGEYTAVLTTLSGNAATSMSPEVDAVFNSATIWGLFEEDFGASGNLTLTWNTDQKNYTTVGEW